MSNTKRKKFSKKQLMFFGFNFIIGYAFVMGLGSSYAAVGNYFILIILLSGVIAFSVGLAYGKMASAFSQNGGAYLYTKKAFGKFPGWMMGWWQYIQAPFTGAVSVCGIIWAFQNLTIYGYHVFNNYSRIYIYALAIVVFIIIVIVLNFGFTASKWGIYIVSIFKWIVILFSLIAALAFFKPHNVINNNYKPSINIFSFVESTAIFFFAFGGFEGLAAISDDLEDSKKNTRTVIATVIVVVTVFYIVYFYAILGCLGPNGLLPKKNESVNPINNVTNTIFSGVIPIISAIFGSFLVFSQICSKCAGRIQNGWINTRLLACVAEDGFIPQKFAKRNKHDQFHNALALDSIATIAIILIYITIIFTLPSWKDKLDALLSIYSLLAFFQFILACMVAIKLGSKKLKIIKLNIFEKILYICTAIILSLLLILFLLSPWLDNLGNSKDLVLQVYTIIGVTILGIVIYYVGKFLGWHNKQYHDPRIDDIHYKKPNEMLTKIIETNEINK